MKRRRRNPVRPAAARIDTPGVNSDSVRSEKNAAVGTEVRSVHINKSHPKLRLDRAQVVAAIHSLDAAAAGFRGGPQPGELSLAFLTDSALAALHAAFLDDPTPTDVITFAGEPAFGSAGEICVSVDAAVREATRREIDLSAELTLYLVHGWLHLAGYDDLRPDRKRLMRAAERRAMALLKTGNAIPDFRLR